MYRFWYRRYFLDRFTRYFGNLFLSELKKAKAENFPGFPRKASSKSTAKPRCCRLEVGNLWAATLCEVCDRSVCVFKINALNLKHFITLNVISVANKFLRFHIKNSHFSKLICRKRACSECSHYGQCKNVIEAYV